MWPHPIRMRDVLWSFVKEPFRREDPTTEAARLRQDLAECERRMKTAEAELARYKARLAALVGLPGEIDDKLVLDYAATLLAKARRG